MVLGFSSGIALAFAADHTIHQKGRKFSVTDLSVKKGDTLVFVNDDNIAHNVLSTTAGNEFNLRSQPPGTSTPVTFDVAGQFKVICAIHPAMRMTVTVE